MSGHSATGGNADAPSTAPRFDLSDDTLRHVGASFVLAYRGLEAEVARLSDELHALTCCGEPVSTCVYADAHSGESEGQL